MSGFVTPGGNASTIVDGDVTIQSINGEILFKTTAGATLRMRIPNSGSPTVEISGDLNLTTGSQYKINGVPISGGSGNFIDNEIPTGTVDGINVVFTLANTPVAGSVSLYQNGMLQKAGGSQDYTITGSTITCNAAPLSGAALLANYRY